MAPVRTTARDSRRRRLIAATFLITALAGSVVAVEAATRPQAVVLITIDALRADRLSAYGYDRPTSPRIDALLDRGLRFEHARTPETLTTPAMCSMITGLPPHRHGASRNGLRMEEGLDSLPKILARHGFSTAAFVTNWPLKDSLSRLGEHFGHYGEIFTRRRWFGLLNAEATGEDATDAAVAWVDAHLEAHPGQPFLLWVHYSEPHAPYEFHRELAPALGIDPRSPTRRDRYDTEVAAVDAAVGRLVQELEERVPDDGLLVAFLADHGESLGEHDYWGHGRHLYEPTLHIPMGFVWEGHIRPGTVAAPATLLDVPPTVLDLLGLPIPDSFAGRSWARGDAGTGDLAEAPFCYQAHKGAVHGKRDSDRARSKGLLAVAMVRDEHKEVLRLGGHTRMLFDLSRDPGELDSLVAGDSEPSPDLVRCLGEISNGLGALDRLVTRRLDAETVEKLRALGYLDEE